MNIPVGWYIRKATAINEVGQIAVYLSDTKTLSPSSKLQAAVIDMTPTSPGPPVLHLIPDQGLSVSSNFGDINNWGDVVVSYRRPNGTFGHYTYNVYNTDPMSISDLGVSTNENSQPNINNAGVIVGTLVSGDGYRTSLSGGITTFPGLSPRAINENGAFCGQATVTTSKPIRTSRYAFVYGTSLTLNTILHSSASDLNSTLDSVLRDLLNHRNLGNFRIVDLLDPTDPNSSLVSANLFCSTMTDRRLGTNFPVLIGSTKISGTGWGVNLIPVSVP